jgi:anti-sigma factor RsiW
MRWRLNSCREHRENISLLASEALPEAEQASVREHLALCAECRQRCEEIVSLSGDFKQWVGGALVVEGGATFRSRWMRSVHAATGSTRTSFAARISRWADSRWPSPLAWGALASVWVCLLSFQWATAPQRITAHEMAKSPSTRTEITFAQRQRELSTLLENFGRPPAPTPLTPGAPRPRTQRRAESAAA